MADKKTPTQKDDATQGPKIDGSGAKEFDIELTKALQTLIKVNQVSEKVANSFNSSREFTKAYNDELIKANKELALGNSKTSQYYKDNAKQLKEQFYSVSNIVRLNDALAKGELARNALAVKLNDVREKNKIIIRDINEMSRSALNTIDSDIKKTQEKMALSAKGSVEEQEYSKKLTQLGKERETTLKNTRDFIKETRAEEHILVNQNQSLIKKMGEQKKLKKDINDEMVKQQKQEKLLENSQKVANTLLGTSSNLFSDIGKKILSGNISFGVFKELLKGALDILFAQNKEVSGIQKNLMLTRDQAREVRSEYVDIERSSQGVFTNTKNLIEAQTQLSEVFGASHKFNKEMLESQILMTKQIGLTGDEAGKLQQITTVFGTTYDQFTKNVAKSTMETKRQTGITFNLKDVMKDVGKLSSATLLSLSKFPDGIQKAVIQAKQLGVDVDKLNSMAESLLNIESSIGAQFEATVLSGKTLNFEKARELALSNDIAGAAKEMLSQIKGVEEFSKMNRITQDAIAKSVGLTRDELANSLITQENLSKLGKEEKERWDDATKFMDEKEKNAYLMKMTNADNAKAAIEQISAQEKINALQEKFKSILSNILSPLEPIVDAFASIFEMLSPIISMVSLLLTPITAVLGLLAKTKEIVVGIAAVYAGIYTMSKAQVILEELKVTYASAKAAIELKSAAIQKVGLMRSIGDAMMKVISSLASIPVVGWVLGAVAAASVAALGYKYLSDGKISPDGGLVVSGAKGTYKLDKNDTVIAGTDLGKQQTETANSNLGNQKIEIVQKDNVKQATEPMLQLVEIGKQILDVMKKSNSPDETASNVRSSPFGILEKIDSMRRANRNDTEEIPTEPLKKEETDKTTMKDVVDAVNKLSNAILRTSTSIKIDSREFGSLVKTTTDPKVTRA